MLWLGATRVRGLRRRRCLPSQRACAWPSGRRDCAALAAWGGLARGVGAALSPPSPPRRSGGCRRTVGLSVPPSLGVDRPQWWMRLCLSLWCGVTGRGLVNQWHFFVPWVMDGPRMRQKDEAAGAKQRAWLCWGLSGAGGHRAVTTSRTPRIALLLTTGTAQCGVLSAALALLPSRLLQHHGKESPQCGGPDGGLVPAVPRLPGRAAVHQALPSSVGASVRHAARIYGSRWERSGRPAHRRLRRAR